VNIVNKYYAIEPPAEAIFSFAEAVNAEIPENVNFLDSSQFPKILIESFL
jgi:hypothetical protein